MTWPLFLSLCALCAVLTRPVMAQPYTVIDRSLGSTPDVDDRPIREALDLAYQARLTPQQFTRTLIRADASGDTTLVPDLWRLARAYARTGSFVDQIFEALRQLGEPDEAFIAEAEAVAPTIPARIPGTAANLTLDEVVHNHNVMYLGLYVYELIDTAAARPDSALLPRVLAISEANERTSDAEQPYINALHRLAQYRALPPAGRLRWAVGAAATGFELPDPVYGGFRGPLPFGPGLTGVNVYGRERLAEFYAADPSAVEAAIDAYVAEAGAGPLTGDLRAYILSVAADAPPGYEPPAPPVCLFGPATVWVDPASVVRGGPLAGQPYAGTLTGTDGHDIIAGTDGDDTVHALGDHDIVCALGGDDTVHGGPGNDFLVGDAFVFGPPDPTATGGSDALFGEEGDDYLLGGPGDDTLDGGPDADTADGGDGTDACEAETVEACEVGLPPAIPTCAGQPATVYVGADGRIVGGPLDGQPYAGRLDGTEGPDVIAGTEDADVIDAFGGDDLLCGGGGNDALDGGDGTDTADGGIGTDGCDTEAASTCEGAVPTIGGVTPFSECVSVAQDGSFVAYFGYDNPADRPGRVPRGPANQVTVYLEGQIQGQVVRSNPVLFALPGVVPGAPGQTPPFPGHAFAVEVESGGQASWTLNGTAVTMTPNRSSPCPAP